MSVEMHQPFCVAFLPHFTISVDLNANLRHTQATVVFKNAVVVRENVLLSVLLSSIHFLNVVTDCFVL